MLDAFAAKQKRFQEVLDRASRTVASWPAWKQEAASSAIQIPKQPEYEVST